jgi:eukaryotic-like serine/threonine-protein kinase
MTELPDSTRTSRWRRLWSLFHRLREADREDRSLLRQELAGEPTLLDEVDELLAADREAPGRGFAPEGGEPPPSTHPERIGPFTIVSVLGRGGMGVVYEAEQTEPIRRRVAIKLLSSELLTPAERGRFEAERQALALMDHSNIAHVYDAGTTESGLPWLAMERIDGLPITEFCDQRRYPMTARLELFISLCEAIQHAHQRGVLHRDLKPSNVMVTMHGERPVAKVIDFGLAKSLDRRLTESSHPTMIGTVLGTPEYMSPEQASLDTPVDTRSDVYSLGVILYELLTGRLPFERDGRAILAYLERICSEEVPPPVRRLRSSAERELSGIAARRATTAPSLIRQLDGELKWIVLRALEKEPDKRYGSPGELALDVRRYLQGEPLVAAPPGNLYRLRKFVTRHREAVAAASLVLVTLIGGLAATARMAAVAREERDRAHHALAAAEQSRMEAAREAEIARATSGFIESVLAAPDPWRSAAPAAARETRIVDVLARARAELQGEVSAHPETAAAIRTSLARTYAGLGMLDEAIDTLAEAAGDASELNSTGLTVLHDYGVLLRRKERFDEAEALLRRAHRGRLTLLGKDHAETFATASELSSLLYHRGEYQSAEASYRSLIDRMRAPLGGSHRIVLAAMNDLAVLLNALGKREEAEGLHRTVLDYRRQTLGPDHPDVVNSAGNYAGLLQELGRLEEALEIYRQANATYQKMLGPAHPRTVSSSNNIAVMLFKLKRLEEAEAAFRQVIPHYQTIYGADHQHSLAARNNLARVLLESGRPAEALGVYRELIPRAEKVQRADHPLLATFRLGYGMTLEALGRRSEAGRQYALTHAVFDASYGADDERTRRAAARLEAARGRQER